MKTTKDQININVPVIENEQVPEWIHQHTVWVETTSTESTVPQEA